MTSRLNALFLFPFLICASCLSGQDAGDQLFDNSFIHEIRLNFTQEDYWETLRQNFETNFDPFSPVPYLPGTVTIDGVVLDSVGVRFKGFTSYTFESDKKPIKLDFNEFVSGQRYDGLRKLNLNNGTADPGLQRDVLCYDLLHRMGVSAPRTAYTRVYFNDEYWGLYQLIEQVDKTFLDRNFSNDDGNLFKNLSWSHLEWLGPNADTYQQIFSLKTNEEVDDWSGFIGFLDLLNNSTDAEFRTNIEQAFNVDLFLRNLAVDVATNNWDSYLEHGRNWYLYEDTATGMFHWIPWDYNLALGGQLGGGGSGDCVVFPNFAPLLEGSTTVSFFNLSFTNGEPTYSWDFGDGTTSTEEEPLHTYSTSGVYEVCLTLTGGEDCSETICNTINTLTDLNDCEVIQDGSADHSVGETFAIVVHFQTNCCSNWNENCEDFYDNLSNSGSFDFTIDQRENNGVLIRRLLEVPAFYDRYQSFFCELMDTHYTLDNYVPFIEQNADLIATHVEEDPNFLFTYESFQEDTGPEGLQMLLAERITALQTDLTENISCGFLPPDIEPGEVVINEFVASNDSTSMISDPAGEFADWIELYNNTEEEIDLSGIQMSDDAAETDKWAFPIGTTIAPAGYLIVWADEDDDQPGLHADFKLSKNGEEIYLTHPDGTVIDAVEFGEQTTNVAAARIPNGTGDFVFQDATFNTNNENPSGITTLPSGGIVKVYPSPAQGQLWLQLDSAVGEVFSVAVFSLAGRQILVDTPVNGTLHSLDVSACPAGFYILRVRDEAGQERSLKWVKQ